MNDRIKTVMAAVFEMEASDISDDASPDTIANWDSIHHMNLVVALEEEFNVKINDDQIGELMNFRLIALVLNELM